MGENGAMFPKFFEDCIVSNDEALKRTVRSGMRIGNGFATSEPSTFVSTLWDHIVAENLEHIRVLQGLFMGPHRLCVGDALAGGGRLSGLVDNMGSIPGLGSLAARARKTAAKLDGLKRLIAHYEEMLRRDIVLESAFLGGATNMLIPMNPLVRALYPAFAGRNTSRNGVTDMHSIHFPDAVDSLAYEDGATAKLDLFVGVMTPPDENGDMSHGPANGANGDVMERVLQDLDMTLLVYVNSGYPFTYGYGDRPNTIHISRFERLARAGRLVVVLDDAPVPATPAGAFQNPSPKETAIARNIVNHIEMNAATTYGRALQVGIGQTGVQAIKLLRETKWWGRQYSEMLEPFTLDLFDAGRIQGSHWIEKNGVRTPLDGKVVCTFSMCEKGDPFYQRLHKNPAVVIAPASRVVIPEGFYGGLGINNCLGIDFQGHINSGGRERNHHSGIGGGAMIIRGLGKGGFGYMCLKSTHRGFDGRRHSSIFPFLPRGTPISHVGPDMMGGRDGARLFVVTEHGVFQTSGRSQSELIRGLIGIADPQFREMLAKAAWEEFRVRVAV